MWNDAFAQAAAAPAQSNPTMSLLLTLLQFLPIFLILYFLLIRPQQQRQKKLDRMLKELKKGDRVLTSGGIFGTIIGINGAKAVLKIAEDTKVEVTKSSIVQLVTEDAR
ncbi:MAG: preprotein translocase subunit YajC [Candidatus Eisenbacteria bacterium RBG_16_71_46]|nr:MAG: preprotein translocase subunit YajC [Candidatus Eisenbacteria bacterium RBG_16_71_46]OGF22948.1 MAG: preprotein translocase subunit YajC [Candidatus Eisenbacteria bacterium RBG_19FT_COMBO_70_11]